MSASHAARRILFVLAVVALLALVASGCGSDDSGSSDGGSDDSAQSDDEDASGGGEFEPAAEVVARDGKYDAAPTTKLDPAKSYVVQVETNKGTFDIEVDPKAAPIAAANFVYLVGEGYYDGVPFHRIMKDFMVQTGDPTGTGMGGPGYTIKDEPVKGKYVNGAVAMARTPAPDSAGSQFFIVHGANGDQALGREYVIFGQVTEEGLEVVDEIANVEVTTSDTGEPSKPVEAVVIESAKLVEGGE